MENVIIQAFSILIQSVFITYYFITLCGNSKTSNKSYITTFIFTTIASIIIAVVNLKQYSTILNTLFFFLMLVPIVKLIFKTSVLKALLTVLSYYLLISIAEVIGFYALSSIFNLSVENIVSIPFNFISSIILQHIIALTFVIVFNLVVTKKYKITDLTFKNMKLLLLMLVGYILPQIIVLSIAELSYPLPIMLINVVQIALISILIFSYFKKIIREDQIKTSLEATETHNKALTEIVDGVKTLKHDFGNIVQALNGYVVTKQYEKLNEYVDSLLKEFDSVNNLSAIDPNIINEPAIYGVVGAKYFHATDDDITFELDITSDVKNICFPKPELSRIFGILLDNAMEATRKATKKYIRLEIHFNDKKYADVIRVINTYNTDITIDLNKIYEKGVSSKEEKSGIGLWEVKKLINKNSNSQIYATIENDKFVQNLIIEKID